MPPDLFSGFAGVAWTVEHLRGRLLDAEADLASGIPAAIQTYLQHEGDGRFDLVYGRVGLGVYALERLEKCVAAGACEATGAATAILTRIVDWLAANAVDLAADRPGSLHSALLTPRSGPSHAWFTPPALLPDWQREEHPEGHFDLGLAHGVPGVIAFLARCGAAGVAPERVGPLLAGAVGWLLAQEGEERDGSGFAYARGPGVGLVPARSGWCYGEPGIAVALLAAARASREAAWEREALRIARRAAARDPEQAGVEDAGLCHGAAGLGHLFNRLYQATGDPALATAARTWFERALAYRRPGEPNGGFAAFHHNENDAPSWVDDPGLLTGAAGVALALIAAATPVTPEWDRVLLV
jgi:hypothetical protein